MMVSSSLMMQCDLWYMMVGVTALRINLKSF
jgi:hypothetical protein